MKRVLVLTTIERAFYSSVIKYQLLEPFTELATRDKKNKYVYVGLVPINQWTSKDGLIKNFILYKKYRTQLKKWLAQNNISCSFLPVLFPLRCKHFYLGITGLVFYVINSLPILFCIVLRHRINFIHSRNYPASVLVSFVNRVLGIPYVFDMRDVYPEKGIEAGIFGKESWSYRLWKFIERRLIKSASYVITTSEPFKEYVQTNFHPSKVIFLPNCVNPLRFKPDNTTRKTMREKYGLSNKFVLLHSGAFGTPKDLFLILKYFLHFKTIKTNTHLVILYGMNKDVPYILSSAKKAGVQEGDLTVLSLSPDEVPKYILLGDVGLHLESMAIATPYGIGVKDGEYLSSGLPIIVTKWQEGIAPFVTKYNAGIVIDTLMDSTKSEENLLKNYDIIKQNGFKLVDEILSLRQNVNKLGEVYLC
ncbi:MAG: glycosyltransferase [bacterium]|nr:glycosyltransferase [bacterium]